MTNTQRDAAVALAQVVAAIAQAVTLIGLFIQVRKAWQATTAAMEATEIAQKALREATEARRLEYSPHVVPYFDVSQGQSRIYFVVENTGRGIAGDVKLTFSPPLANSWGEDIGHLPLLQSGISSLAPGQVVRTFFDDTGLYLWKESRCIAAVSSSRWSWRRV